MIDQNRSRFVRSLGSRSQKISRLQRREPAADAVFLEQEPHGRLDAEVAFVFEAAAFDVDSQKQLAVSLLVPADVIVDLRDVDRMGIREAAAEVFFDFLFERGEAPNCAMRYLQRGRLCGPRGCRSLAAP